MADDVTLNIRTRGARQAARETKDVASGVGAIGRQARTAAGGMRTLRQNSTLANSSLSAVRRSSVAAGVGILGLGAVSARMGLQFNASMEQNQVAFTQFLGSSQAARRELKYLYKTAAATPFEVPQITMAARRLLAFNFSARESNAWLQTIGDTAAGAGQGAEGIDRLVTAIGQIRAKGRLQGDELLQLSELGVLDPGQFAKRLGITKAELFGGNANISSRRALRALKAQFDDTFGGQSAKQARTFNGQMSTLHDNLNMTLGAITRPAFRDLEKRVFPALNASSGQINRIFNRRDLDLSQKITLSRGVLRRRLGPFVEEIRHAIGEAHIPEHIGDAIGDAFPRIASAAGQAAPHAAKAFVDGWLHSGTIGQLITGGWLLSKLGGFRSAGSQAGQAYGFGFGKTANLTIAGVLGYTAIHNEAMKHSRWSQYSGSKGWGELGADIKDWLPGRDHDTATPRSRGQVPKGFRRRADGSVVRTAAPSRGSAVHLVPIEVKIEGKQVARAVARTVEDTRARR